MTLRNYIEDLFDLKIIKFLSAGLLNTIFGYSVYAVLIFIDVPYLAALFAATIAGVIFNYYSFRRLVFNGYGGRLVFSKFIIAYAAIYGVNAILLKVLIHNLLFNQYLSQVICIPLSVFMSWLLMRNWVYKNG